MGKKGGGGGGTQVVQQKADPPAYLLPYLEQGVKDSAAFYEKGAPALYPNKTYVPINQTQTEALNKTLALARGGNPAVTSAQSFLQNTLDTQSGSNPYLDDLMERYGAKANAQVMSNFNKSGRMGSGANAAVAAREISDATLPYLFDQYNKDNAMKLQAAGMAPTLAQFDFDNASRIGSVGDVYQGYDQMALDEAMMRYNYNNGGAEASNLDDFLARINGSAANNYGTSTQSTTGGGQKAGIGSTLGGIVSGLGTLGGMGSGLMSFLGGGSGLAGMLGGTGGLLGSALGFLGFSDRRMKENIEFVGTEKGHNLYAFNYKGKPERRFIGVMADEVEKTHPEAIRDVEGFKAVDYRKIGLEMREVPANTPPVERAAAPVSRGGTVETGVAGCMLGGA